MESSTLKQDERKEQQTRQEEENLAARRAGVEAIDIGRETLMVAAAQNEQIAAGKKPDLQSLISKGQTWTVD